MILKKMISGWLAVSLCTGCATMDPAARTALATQSGAVVGGAFGSALGDQLGGYHGSFWGSMLGSVAGAAVGAAAASNSAKREQMNSRVYMSPAPTLVIKDIILKDRNGNQCIDAGEPCQITFVIANEGDANAMYVEPVIKAKGNAKKIRLSPPVRIARICPEEKISYTVQAQASEKLKNGEAEFEIYLRESGENATPKEQFAICTRGYR